MQSAHWLRATGCALGAYALGCFATGYYLVRSRTGRDLREIESGSVGARNVGRILGKAGYILTMLCDMAKGALAVWFVAEFTNYSRLAMALAVLAVVAGHAGRCNCTFAAARACPPRLRRCWCLIIASR